ncbi:MAG: leucine-rich repeat domain-containing protein [Bacteroidales bacterium]|nr:leucine-rich repeat domain-containing protein [Bacteroidales bacterium]
MNKYTFATLFLFLAITVQAGAYDFKKSLQGGVTLYFSISKSVDNEVSVVAPLGEKGYGNMQQPSGRVTIPDEVQYDGERYRVTAIRPNAFAGCDVTAVTIPEGVTNIEVGAFDKCLRLRSLTLRCDSLAQAVNAFGGCKVLDTIVIEKSVRVLPPFVFAELKTLKYIRLLANGERMKNLFFGLKSKAVLAVGGDVNQIPPFICYNFIGLQDVDYEDEGRSLSTIGQCAFAGCTSLRNIEITANVSRIDPYAYAHCTPQSLTFVSKRPPSVSEIAFYGIDNQTPVYIPCLSRGVYANSRVGRFFGNLVYVEDCGDGVEAEVVYVHDTVFIHDTVYVPYTEFVDKHFVRQEDTVAIDDEEPDRSEEDETDEADAEQQWLFIDGKVLRISRATMMRGVSVRVFDDKGRLVVDERIPDDQPVDNYYVKLPKRQRYFLRFDMGAPVVVDVATQEIKF